MMNKRLRGAGGGGGGGGSSSSRTPVISADSLTSRQYARVLDLVSEGEIEGLVDGHRSIFLDDTPLQNADGTYNFSGFTVESRTGAVAQDHIPGFPAVESAYSVGIEIKHATPVVRQLSNPNIDAVRINLAVPNLYTQDASTGDVSGASIDLTIEVKPFGGSYALARADTISGKASSRYNRNYRIELPGTGPWNIRITKVTDDTNTATTRDLYWESSTEIVDGKFSFPNSALVGITIDSSQFSNIPTRGYDLKGLRIKVPSNYDPVTRAYTGLWDGTFHVAWSDNPAWCFYDLLTNPRYGLGEFVSAAQVDKANLYTIGRYCDELVPDGFGGQEPRFACNLYLQTREDAFKVLSDMAGLFRGMLFWASGGLSCTQDRPEDPLYPFTNANVIDGLFTYSGSSRNVRHTTALISYNDPNDRYQRKVEYVEDAEGIAKYGIRQYEAVAIGCASRGQAHRFGKCVLLTERYLTETCTWKTGLEGSIPYPGAVCPIQDNNRAGARLGGRVRTATTTSVTLDRPVTLEAGESYVLTIVKTNGEMEERGIIGGDGELQTVTPTTAFSAAPAAQSIWVLSSTSIEPQLFKVISAKELDGMIFEITALQYNPGKFAAIEQNLKFEPLQTSLRDAALYQAPVSNLQLTEDLFMMTPSVVGTRISVGWTGSAVKYLVTLTGDGQNPINAEVYTPLYVLDNAPPGMYTVTVTAVNGLGSRSLPVTLRTEVYGKLAPPRPVVGLSLAAISGAAHLSWQASVDFDVLVGGSIRIRHIQPGQTADWNNGVDIGQALAGTATAAVLPLLAGSYMAKWVDSSGYESDAVAFVTTDAPDVMSMNVVVTATESPSFAGAKVNTGIISFLGSPALTLDSATTLDDMTALIDSWGLLNALGGVSAAGEYYFANSVDLGAVHTSRLTATIEAYGYDTADLVDSWAPIDDLLSIDGTNVSDTFAVLQVRTTNVDPVSNVWSDWGTFFVGFWTARAFQFRLLLSRGLVTHSIAVSGLEVQVDMPDRLESGDDLSAPIGGVTINFAPPFYVAPALGITAQGMASGDYYTVSKTAASFTIQFFNASNASIARTFDYIARSY